MKNRSDERKFDVSLGICNDWSNDTKYFLTQGSTVKSRRILPTQYSNNMLSSSVHASNKLCRNMYHKLYTVSEHLQSLIHVTYDANVDEEWLSFT
jgi:hypothetical protein